MDGVGFVVAHGFETQPVGSGRVGGRAAIAGREDLHVLLEVEELSRESLPVDEVHEVGGDVDDSLALLGDVEEPP